MRAKSLATAEAVRRESGMPVVARVSGESGKLFAVVRYPDGLEEERGVGDRLRGTSCKIESVSDLPEAGVPVRCGKTKTKLQIATGQSSLSAPAAVAAPQAGVANAQLSPPAMVPVSAGQPPLYGSAMPLGSGPQMKAQ